MRALATAALAFSGAIFAAHYLIPPRLYLVLAIICALLSLGAIFLRGMKRRYFLLISLALSLGFALSLLSYGTKSVPAREISGKACVITARVTDYPEQHADYSTVTLKLTGNSAPKLKAVLYSFDEKPMDLKPGDLVSAPVTLKAADERYGRPVSRYNAEGVYLLCYLDGEAVVTGKSVLGPLYFPKTLAKAVKDVSQKVFPASSAPLMTALLTGDGTLLYADDTRYAQMAKAGVLHVVAVSGMNVAFLIGFLRLVIRRKRLASYVGIPVILLFIPFAGATPSVMRAALMQSMVLLAPLFRRENDGATSLTAVLAIMLLVNPAACASISLQLSFLATLGILLLTPRIYRPGAKAIKAHFGKTDGIFKRAACKTLTAVWAAFAATLGAIAFSTPLSALYFGYVSVIGIVVNLLIFWVISVCFILGFAACFSGLIWLPLGKMLGALTSLGAGYMMDVVKLAAEMPYAAVYTEGNVFVYWLIAVYIIFMAAALIRRGGHFRPVLPTALAVSLLCCAILYVEFAAGRDSGSFTAVNVGQGQSLVFTCGKATAVIDCGGKGTQTNAGDTVAAFLQGEGRQTVDLLALTHFDEDHVNGVVRLMSRVKVSRLLIPDGSYDKKAREEILDEAEKLDVQVYIISNDTVVTADGLTLDIYAVVSQDAYALMFMGCIGNFEAFISGDADTSEEQRFLENHALPDTEVFVAGHHGSKYSSGGALIKALRAEYAVVSSGYNSYGHPTKEALSRFDSAGMTILRTDELGNISLKAA